MREVDVRELSAARRAGAVVVDVREPVEYVTGHVPGAILIPLGQLPERMRELPRSPKLYVICASGNRSRTAAEWLTVAGLDAVSVRGGTTAWLRSGGSVVRGPRADGPSQIGQ